METHERLKFIREDLKMSRAAFGETLGVSGDVINNLERGRVEIKEYMLRLICKTHNVNYFWLTEEKGDIYLSVPQIIVDEAIKKYELDDGDRAIIEEYVMLSPEIRSGIKELIRNVVKKAPE